MAPGDELSYRESRALLAERLFYANVLCTNCLNVMTHSGRAGDRPKLVDMPDGTRLVCADCEEHIHGGWDNVTAG